MTQLHGSETEQSKTKQRHGSRFGNRCSRHQNVDVAGLVPAADAVPRIAIGVIQGTSGIKAVDHAGTCDLIGATIGSVGCAQERREHAGFRQAGNAESVGAGGLGQIETAENDLVDIAVRPRASLVG